MERSDDITELATALALAQLNMGTARKTSANPHFKSRYADLSEVWDACHAALNSNKLAVIQTPVMGDGELGIRTMLVHSSGQWIASTVFVALAKNDAHGVGSAMTYARRYGLSALVGVCPEDDDGNAASMPLGKARERVLPVLHTAAMNGTQALSVAWSSLAREEQIACKEDKDSLKVAAARADAAIYDGTHGRKVDSGAAAGS